MSIINIFDDIEIIIDLLFSYDDEMVLLDWIDINKINWIYLSGHPNAIHILK